MNIFKKSVVLLGCAALVGTTLVVSEGIGFVKPSDKLTSAHAAGDSFKVDSTKVSFQRSVKKMLSGVGGGGGGGMIIGKITYKSNGDAASAWTCRPGDKDPNRTCTKAAFSNKMYTNKNVGFDSVSGLGQVGYTTANGTAVCFVEIRNGYKVIPEGAVQTSKKITTRKFKDGKKISETSTTSYGEANCVYAKEVKHNKTLDCILTVKGSTTRTANSFLKKAATVGKTKTQDFSGNGIVSNIEKEKDCITADKVQFDYSGTVGRQQVNWGIYNVNLNLDVVRCRFGSKTFDGKKEELVDCKNPTKKTDKITFTIMCNSVFPYARQSSWTGSECVPPITTIPRDPDDPFDPKKPNPISKPDAYMCSLSNPATYDGKSGNVEALRDGKLKNLVWGKPVLKGGLRNDINWRQTTKLLKGSSPNIPELSATHSKQLYKYPSGFNSSYKKMSGRPTVSASPRTDKLAFYTAGAQGEAFQMERQYKFDAQYRIFTYDVIAVKPGGKIVYGNRQTIWVPIKDTLCGPQKSPKISVIRAIGTQSNK